MKRSQLVLLSALLLLLAVSGVLLPHGVIAYWKSKMQSMTWTQARQEDTLHFEKYTRQFGEIEIAGNLSEQNIKDALQNLIIIYIQVGLLPDISIVTMTMPEYSLYYDAENREMLSATLQSDDDTVQIVLRSDTLFPVSFSYQGPKLFIDASRFAMLLSQHYQIKGGCTKTDDGVCHFASQDGTLEYTVTPFTVQNNEGITMQTVQ